MVVVVVAAVAAVLSLSAAKRRVKSGDDDTWKSEVKALNARGLELLGVKAYAEAEVEFRAALVIYEARVESTHPNVATSLGNLATCLHQQERYAEAEPIVRRALAIRVERYGPSHPAVATSTINLAQLLSAAGRRDEAAPLFRRAKEIDDATRPAKEAAEDAEDAWKREVAARNGRGLEHLEAKDYIEAEAQFRAALAIYEARVDAKHPNVATLLGNVATCLHHLERYAEAEPLLRRALAIREELYGRSTGHPAVALFTINLGQLLAATGREDEALRTLPLYRRAKELDAESR